MSGTLAASDGARKRSVLKGAGMTLTLRCYAYSSGQNWEAICVDLDIATFGASLNEVKASLATCIEMYLEGIAELPDEERQRFLTRRSPWHARTKLAIMAWLSSLRRDARRALQFTLQSQAPAHP